MKRSNQINRYHGYSLANPERDINTCYKQGEDSLEDRQHICLIIKKPQQEER
jgi:hypothetical protein